MKNTPHGPHDASVLVLSPHRDDAAFSCGLLLEHLTRRGTPIRIANICTISDYAPYAPSHWHSDVPSITYLRTSEDEAFLTLLRHYSACRTFEVTLLDLLWQDAPLRHQIPAEKVLAPNPILSSEVQRLTQAFRALETATVVLAPLGLGGHIDHRLARDAAAATWAPDNLLFYEDLPYACRIPPSHRRAACQAAAPWACDSAQTPPSAPGIKRRMALCYGSQIEDAVADEMERHAAAMFFTERLHGTAIALRALTEVLASQTL